MKCLSQVESTNDELLQRVGELKAGDDFRLCLRWLLSIHLDTVNSTFGLSLFRCILKLTISLLEVYITSLLRAESSEVHLWWVRPLT